VIRNVLESISGVEIYPLISLTIFAVFFVSVIIWVVKLDKKTVARMKNLPLDDNDHTQFIGRK
jgi:cbb3-type cytochrome oxidase subunit 3